MVVLVVEDVLLLLEEGELTGALDEEELTDALEVAAADDTGVNDDDPKSDDEDSRLSLNLFFTTSSEMQGTS